MKIYNLFTLVLAMAVLFACKKEEETNSAFGVVKEHASEIKFQFYMNNTLMDFRKNAAYSNLTGANITTIQKQVEATDGDTNPKYQLQITLVNFNGVGTYEVLEQYENDNNKNKLRLIIKEGSTTRIYTPVKTSATFVIEEYDETTKLIKGKFEAKYLEANKDTISITGGEFYIGQVSISSAEAGKK